MLAPVLLVAWLAAEHGATTPPDPPVPSNTVQDIHKYYNLSVYQNNVAQSFDKNFIDMENAEIKHGNNNTTVTSPLRNSMAHFICSGLQTASWELSVHYFRPVLVYATRIQHLDRLRITILNFLIKSSQQTYNSTVLKSRSKDLFESLPLTRQCKGVSSQQL